MTRARPVGTITRGTTSPNRLRRCDRWIAGTQAWRLRRADESPVVVDLGYGRSPVTALELHQRLTRLRSDVQVVGIEIDPARVQAAAPLERPGLHFQVGGFEIPLEGRQRPTVVRAFNVLRQYSEDEVGAVWARVCRRLTPEGLFVDGTCDEIGRRAAWVALERSGPVSLTLSWRLAGLQHPSEVAPRLPKCLIHRNVPGEPVYAYLRDLDATWERHATASAWGSRQRFVAAAAELAKRWPLLDGPSRWRLGELTVAWPAVEPNPHRPPIGR